MFHVEQSVYTLAFHVKQKSLKSHYLVGFLRILDCWKIIFVLSSCCKL